MYHKLTPKEDKIPKSLATSQHAPPSRKQTSISNLTPTFWPAPINNHLHWTRGAWVPLHLQAGHCIWTWWYIQSDASSHSRLHILLYHLHLQPLYSTDENVETAYVTPIPNSGDPTSASNYCPVSFLPLISKVIERIVHSIISKFLHTNKLLSDCQFGFRPRSSTQDALLSVTNCCLLVTPKLLPSFLM